MRKTLLVSVHLKVQPVDSRIISILLIEPSHLFLSPAVHFLFLGGGRNGRLEPLDRNRANKKKGVKSPEAKTPNTTSAKPKRKEQRGRKRRGRQNKNKFNSNKRS